jgi:uncharacterized membrane protein YgdD (TMEM256/DUF423 family)
MRSIWITVGAVLGFLAVALGAFGAHALRERLTAEEQALWKTAADYHLAHALALVLVGVLGWRTRATRVAGVGFLLGVVLFSGSLYAMALGAPRWLGAITPLGGTAFLVAWLALAITGASRAKIER